MERAAGEGRGTVAGLVGEVWGTVGQRTVELRPIVHFAGEDDIVFPAGRQERTLPDYEIVLNLGTGVVFEAAGTRYPLQPGDAFVCRPGEPHALVYDGRSRVRLIFCHHRWEPVGSAGPPPEAATRREALRYLPDPCRWPVYLPAGPHAPALEAWLVALVTALWRRVGVWQWASAIALNGAASCFEQAADQLPGCRASGGPEPAAVSVAARFIATHFMERSVVTRAAQAAAISTSQLERLFRQTHGLTPRAYLQGLRLGRACIALVHSDRSVEDIAHSAGLPDPRYFSRFFRRYMGLSPSQYRRRYAGRWAQGEGPGPQTRPWCAGLPDQAIPRPEASEGDARPQAASAPVDWGLGHSPRPYPLNVHFPGP